MEGNASVKLDISSLQLNSALNVMKPVYSAKDQKIMNV